VSSVVKRKKTAMLVPKSYKSAYPFKLGTTSFIYQDGYVPNVKMLGPYLDEIELLLFESKPGSLPNQNEIDELSILSKEFDITYNIHLPTDISFGHKDLSVRKYAIETILRVLDLTSPLSPSTCTLHLSYDEVSAEIANVKRWQALTCDTIKQLISFGVKAEEISIETLDYPFKWVKEIVQDFKFTICMDIGHLIICGVDIKTFFDSHCDNISIIHLHGIKNGHDHKSLNKLSEERAGEIMEILKIFKKIVSLEIFSYDDLTTSLKYLEKCWHKIKLIDKDALK
jgi:adenosylcobalamin phosphodiesterase